MLEREDLTDYLEIIEDRAFADSWRHMSDPKTEAPRKGNRMDRVADDIFTEDLEARMNAGMPAEDPDDEEEDEAEDEKAAGGAADGGEAVAVTNTLEVVLRAVDQASPAIKNVSNSVKGLESSAAGVGQIWQTIGGVGATAAIGMAAKAVFDFSAGIEQATITYESLLGSAEAASQRIAELKQFAAETPFDFTQVVQADRLLTTFGARSVEVLTLVGDAASNAGQRFDEVAFWVGRAYTAIQAGKPFGEASMRLMEMGLLSGVARTQIEDLAASGASADQVWTAFAGNFEKHSGAMAKQADTALGRISTLIDTLTMKGSDLTIGAFDAASDAIATVTEVIESPAFAENAEAVGGMVVSYAELAGEVFRLAQPLLVAVGLFARLAVAVNTFALDSLGFLVDKLADAQEAVIDLMGPLFDFIDFVAEKVGWGETEDAVDDVTASLGNLGSRLSETAAGLGDAEAATNSYNRATADLAKGMNLTEITSNIEFTEEKWKDAAKAADDARRAFFDALNAPSPERMARQAVLAQAELNLAKLQQKIDAGMGDESAGPGWDGLSIVQVAEWIETKLIPAQEKWLDIDALQTDKTVTLAESALAFGRSLDEVAGITVDKFVPSQKDLYEATYTASDALANTSKSMDSLANKPPITLKVQAELPTKASLNRAIADIDPTETVKVGMRPNGFSRNALNSMTNIIARADPSETVKVGMSLKPPGGKAMESMNRIIERTDPTETVKVGMHLQPPGPKVVASMNSVISRVDPTETVKVGMTANPPKQADMNKIIRESDPTETVKAGMTILKPGLLGTKTPNQIIVEAQKDATETVKVGMSTYMESYDRTSATLEALRQRIIAWVQARLPSFGITVPSSALIPTMFPGLGSGGAAPAGAAYVTGPGYQVTNNYTVNLKVDGGLGATEFWQRVTEQFIGPALRRLGERGGS